MKLSIFPKAGKLSAKVRVYKATEPETVEIDDISAIADYITTYLWSPSVFNGTRASKNWASMDYLALDVDEEMPIKEAEEILNYLRCSYILAPTMNHQKEKNGVVCDRYRIIFPLSESITNREDYKATWNRISKYFPADTSCRDVSRAYWPSTGPVIVKVGMRTLKPIKAEHYGIERSKPRKGEGIGKLSIRTESFLSGTISTNWHLEYLYACRDMKAQGYTKEDARAKLLKVTGHLDTWHDLPQLEYVYNDNTVEFDWRKNEHNR